MRKFLVVFVCLSAAAIASALSLPVVDVNAPAVNCIFDPSCTIVVQDTTAPIVLPGATGAGFLQSRTFMAAPGSPADGLFGYEYRIDLRQVTGTLAVPCVNSLRLDFGPGVSLDYDIDGDLERVYIITTGGLGSVGPTSADKEGNHITFHFGTPVCAGETSYFFGLASARAPRFTTARMTETLAGSALFLEARVPDVPPSGCAPRPDLNDDLTPAERSTLTMLQEDFLTAPVLGLHLTTPGIHGSSLFLPWHREYISDLENFLIAQGHPEFVPLPKWNPGKPIPAESTVIDGDCSSPPSCASLANLTPNLPLPSNLQPQNVCSNYSTQEALRLGPPSPGLEGWHNGIHVSVGGAMGQFNSPAAVIFWPWHAFVDDVWRSWQCCPGRFLTASIRDLLVRACLLQPCWPIWFGLDDPRLRDPSGASVHDRRGFDNSGALVGNPLPVPGKVGGALRFDGVGAFVQVADHPELDVGESDFSLDAWIRTSQRGHQPIVTKKAPLGAGYQLFLMDGRLGVELVDSAMACDPASPRGCSMFVAPKGDAADGEWHHVAATVDRDGMGTLYLDSIPVHRFDPAMASGDLANDADFFIGAAGLGTRLGPSANAHLAGASFFSGEIDELSLYRFVLTEDEIDQFVIAGPAGKYGALTGFEPVVPGPCLEDLRQLIVNLELISGRENNSLLVKVDHVRTRKAKGDLEGARRMLRALINQAHGLSNNDRYERGIYETIAEKAESCLQELGSK